MSEQTNKRQPDATELSKRFENQIKHKHLSHEMTHDKPCNSLTFNSVITQNSKHSNFMTLFWLPQIPLETPVFPQTLFWETSMLFFCVFFFVFAVRLIKATCVTLC